MIDKRYLVCTPIITRQKIMNSGINSTMGPGEWLMLLTLSVLWGGSFFFVEVAISELPPLTIVSLRVLLAAVALWIFAFSIGLRLPVTAGAWRAFLIMGALNNVIPFTLIVWGQTHIASGLAAILLTRRPNRWDSATACLPATRHQNATVALLQ
ncbi:MAG: DMT family transporter [Candidatus Sedimenticola sp. PURPLELP]